MKGFFDVFRFTFANHVRQKAFLCLTLILAFLLLIVPPAVMTIVAATQADDNAFVSSAEGQFSWPTNVKNVYVVDHSNTLQVDWNFLSHLEGADSISPDYTAFSDQESALQAADLHTVVLVLTYADGNFQTFLHLPSETELTEDDIADFASSLEETFFVIRMLKAEMTQEQVLLTLEAMQSASSDAASDAEVLSILRYLLPYLNFMVLYFMLVIYGQGVANSVLLEKNSKLLDTFLVYVPTSAMIFGKVTAKALTALTQLLLWVLALCGGFALGKGMVELFYPQAQMGLLTFLDSLSLFGGLFSLSGILLSLLVLVAGFFLYCAMASIGGSLASKQEDLASTQLLFNLVVLGGFFLLLSQGVLNGEAIPTWLNYLPFTAVMVTPSQVLLGDLSPWQGLLSVGILLLSAVLLMWLAGVIYRMTAFYKGNPPNLQKLWAMWKNEKKNV